MTATTVHTTSAEAIEALILSCQPWVEKMAHKYAREWNRVEYEEFVSIGMLEICKAAPHAYATAVDPRLYLCKAAHYEMLGELDRIRAEQGVSLDAPLKVDHFVSLADLLPDVSKVPSPSSKRARALNGAIRRLRSTRQRAAVRRLAGLPGYGIHNYQEAMRVLKASSGDVVHCLDQRGRRNLRKDAKLCAALGVEVAQ